MASRVNGPLHSVATIVASKGRPYRTMSVEGHDILVGRGARENDELTFEVAAPEDFWLHVAGGVAGSHVVVRNPLGLDALPPPVLERAAALAAWHSKARGRARVEVHFCRVADVHKPRSAPPGEVELRRWQRVRVSAREPGVL
jgi:predicted ribosome quality control (RQC) complex YloA/Tae2 family protein